MKTFSCRVDRPDCPSQCKIKKAQPQLQAMELAVTLDPHCLQFAGSTQCGLQSNMDTRYKYKFVIRPKIIMYICMYKVHVY